jgi:hypothetical protein
LLVLLVVPFPSPNFVSRYNFQRIATELASVIAFVRTAGHSEMAGAVFLAS